MWTWWHPYPVHKFTNRMRSTHHPSGLQFFYLMTIGWDGVRFTTYKPDDTPIQSIRLTIYEPDVKLFGSQILKNRTEWSHSGVLPKISKLLNKKKGIWVISSKIIVELKFYMRVQEESVGVEEEFVQIKAYLLHTYKGSFYWPNFKY